MHTLGNHHKHNRRAVGSIIGGIFIILILVMAYTLITLGNQEVNNQQQTVEKMRAYDIERAQEAFKTDDQPTWTTDHLTIAIQNMGPRLSNIVNIGVWDGIASTWRYDTTLEVLDGSSWVTFNSPESIKSGEYATFRATIPGVQENPTQDLTYKLQFLTDKGTIFEAGYPDSSKNPEDIINIINQGIAETVGDFLPFRFQTAIQWTILNDDNTINPNDWHYGPTIIGDKNLVFKTELVYYGDAQLSINKWSSLWFTSTEGKSIPPGHGTIAACYIVNINGNLIQPYITPETIQPSEEGTPITLYFGDWDSSDSFSSGPEIGSHDLPLVAFTSLAIYGDPQDPSSPTYGQTYSLMATYFIESPPPSSITVVKDSQPNDPTIFDFSGSLGSFFLTDNGGANSKSFNNLLSGTYTLTEASQSGWTLTDITITGDINGDSTKNVGEGSSSIRLDPGEDIIVTYTNKRSLIFEDNFENGLNTQYWVTTRTDLVSTPPQSPNGGYYAQLQGRNTGSDGSAILTVSTLGYDNIEINYMKKAYINGSGENFKISWRVGTSGSWIELDNLGSADTIWSEKGWTALVDAQDKQAVYVWLRLENCNNGDYGYFDLIQVRGTPTITP